MTAINPTLAAAIAATGVPLSADYAPQPATPRWHQLRHELIATFRPYMPETAAAKTVDLVDEVITEALLEGTAEIRRLKEELERRTEDLAFLERTTLPELRRTIQRHEDGKKRWRDRAEKAEARVAELETTSVPDEAEYAVRMPGSNDVWPRKEFRMGHWERVLCEGGVLLERVIRRGPWVEAPNQCPGFEGNPVAPDQCAGCGELRDSHEEAGR